MSGGITFNLLHLMLHAVAFFGALGIVEAVEGAHEVTGDAADALERLAVLRLGAAALGAHVSDDAVVTAHGIAIHRMVH